MQLYEKLQNELDEMEKSGALKYFSKRIVTSEQGGWFTIGGKKVLNLCSTHYLGFAPDARLKKAAKQAIDKYGIGTGYRTLVGTHALHVELESRLAHFKGAEAAIVLTGGYMANMTAIQTIISREDIIVSDELNHASIIDAIRLSQVKNKFIYKHANMHDLEKQLQAAAQIAKVPKSNGETPMILIITDGVFSMDGDLAPLPKIVELAKQYEAITMVDDAHGEGVLGRGGRGIVDHFGLHGKLDIEVGTLSKAFSVMGGFITGKKVLIDYYRQKSRQYMFSNALTIPDTAALVEAVSILEESDAQVKKLWDNAKILKEGLQKSGFDTGVSETPITPIMLGDEKLAQTFASKLFDEGVMGTAIVFPMVARGAARIRLLPSASHTKEDIDMAINTITKVGRDLGIIK